MFFTDHHTPVPAFVLPGDVGHEDLHQPACRIVINEYCSLIGTLYVPIGFYDQIADAVFQFAPEFLCVILFGVVITLSGQRPSQPGGQ